MSKAPTHLTIGAWGFLLACFTVAFFRTAWVADDAFITFRTIDNALNGLGLTWNPSERVQSYTHPLWLGIHVPLIAFLKDPYTATLLISYGLLIATLVFALLIFHGSGWAAWVFVAALIWSRSFIDYSSSGLENPLTHILLMVFLWYWLRGKEGERTLALSLIASGLFLTRPDAVLLVLPALMLEIIKGRRVIWFGLGLVPAILWVLFSLFYYGSYVPNTALAKIGVGHDLAHKFQQAWAYLNWTFTNDPVSIALLLGGMGCGLLKGMCRPPALGLLLWTAYLFWVGGDYMGGRFLSGPVLMAAMLLARSATRGLAVACLLLLLANLQGLGQTLFSPSGFDNKIISESGVADERGFYYRELGLVPSLQRGTWFYHRWLMEGALIRKNPGIYARCTIGMIGYAAGPDVFWIDPLALAEPFLARLPARSGARVGHYERAFPPGYLDSRVSGGNVVQDQELRTLYSDVGLASRAPLMSSGRMEAIWRLNAGHYASALNFDKEGVGLPGVPVQTNSRMACFGRLLGGDESWYLSGSPVVAHKVLIQW